MAHPSQLCIRALLGHCSTIPGAASPCPAILRVTPRGIQAAASELRFPEPRFTPSGRAQKRICSLSASQQPIQASCVAHLPVATTLSFSWSNCQY